MKGVTGFGTVRFVVIRLLLEGKKGEYSKN
jgi:hypothetical protein